MGKGGERPPSDVIKTPPKPTPQRRPSIRDIIGHEAEHQAAHRLTEKVGFAAAEQALLVGEGVLTRAADDARRRAGASVKTGRFPWRTRGGATPPALAWHEKAADRFLQTAWAPACLHVLKTLLPLAALYLLAGLAISDRARARREWREKRLYATTCLFYAAAGLDAVDAALHAVIVGAHVWPGPVDHHVLHDVETWAICVGAWAFVAMVLGEVISNNRVRAGLASAAHAVDDALDAVVHHHGHHKLD
mmetsp:Transcript_5764/g.17002  ORF Transcript_5764/g.17002 Transcript_5764/m.17002 type:complete len:248 (+) Transcript_5764:193-936(+)